LERENTCAAVTECWDAGMVDSVIFMDYEGSWGCIREYVEVLGDRCFACCLDIEAIGFEGTSSLRKIGANCSQSQFRH
jgi:hypothetical protein